MAPVSEVENEEQEGLIAGEPDGQNGFLSAAERPCVYQLEDISDKTP